MILVTGSTGIVGARIVFDLLQKGRSVRAMRRPNSNLDFVKNVFRFYDPNNGHQLFDQIEWVNADLTDIFSIEDALNGINEVYHAAALVSYAPGDADALIEFNAEGTANMVNAALEAGIQKFCHISSVAALGKPRNGTPATEKNWWSSATGSSTYGLSKYMAEREVWRGASEGLNVIIVNPSIIFGPARPDQSSGMLMNLLRRELKYFPPGSAGYVDVRDVSDISIQLMESNHANERFILNAATVSYKDLLHTAAFIYGNKPPTFAVRPWMLSIVWRFLWLVSIITRIQPKITKETARSASMHSIYSNEKIKKTLGMNFIEPRASLEYFSRYYS
jgi:nucleoside-diphosphate-sugar epimerase